MNTFPPVISSPASSCPSQKRSFLNSAAAESFSNEIAVKYPNQVRQHAYACEDCPNWHLSAMTADSHAMVQSRSNLPKAEQYSAPDLPGRLSHLQSKIKETYQRLYQDRGQYHGLLVDVVIALKDD